MNLTIKPLTLVRLATARLVKPVVARRARA